MDLSNLMKEKIEALFIDGTVNTMVDAAAKKMIAHSIEQVLSPYGEISKQIEKELKEKLRIDLTEMPIAEYNHYMLKAVRDELNNYFEGKVEAELKERMAKLFSGEIPKEITISELIEKFKEDAFAYQEDESGEITVDTSDFYEGNYSLFHLYFDEERGKRKYDCGYSMMLDKKTGSIRSVQINGTDPKTTRKIGGLHGFDRLLLQMYASGTKIICTAEEMDKIDTSYGQEY